MRHPRLAATVGLAFGVTVLTAPASWAADAADISAAVAEFKAGDHVYVMSGANADEAQIEAAIDGTDVYVGVFTTDTRQPVNSTQLSKAGEQGVYLSITSDGNGGHNVNGDAFRVVDIPLTRADFAQLTSAHRGDTTGLAVATVERVRELGQQAQAGRSETNTGTSVPRETPASDNSSGLGFFPVLLLGGAAVFGAMAFRKRKRQQALAAQEFAEVRSAAEEDVTALGESVTRLDLDISTARPETREVYEQALAAYDRSKEALAQARQPEDLRKVSEALEEGRWALTATQASARGEALPERRPPCFFNPQHGPSVADTDFAPDGGAPRPIPVCAADLDRVERGEDPDVRQLSVGGRQVPYYNAGPAYGPWAGGYYGGFGSVMPSVFGGLLLADLMTPGGMFGGFGGGFGGGYGGGYGDGGHGGDAGADTGGGDWGGGGDFGGGDFGGGDFGGGDFGGGDFGGGDF